MKVSQLKSLKEYSTFYLPKINEKKDLQLEKKKMHFGGLPKNWSLYLWQNQYKNLHLVYQGFKIRQACNYIFKKKKVQPSIFLYHRHHGGLKLLTKCLSFYNPKVSKFFKSYRFLSRSKIRRGNKKKLTNKSEAWGTLFQNKIFRGLAKRREKINKFKKQTKQDFKTSKFSSQELSDLGRSLLLGSNASTLSLSFWHEPLPKTYIMENASSAFSKFRSNIHFWSGLQTLKLVVLGRGSSQLLAQYVCNGVRRNRKRVAFIIYIKRLIDWHFYAAKDLKIQGIRIETKGRFNAKSRCRKYILSVGRVAKGEKTKGVDYAFTKAITVFGSLGIKVWICPLVD